MTDNLGGEGAEATNNTGTPVTETERAIMLGIRHRGGREVQFWIPAPIIASIVPAPGDPRTPGLSSWMREEGLLDDEAEAPIPPGARRSSLKTGLGRQGVALIDVERDSSICPSCGALLPWLNAPGGLSWGRRPAQFGPKPGSNLTRP